MPDINHIFSWQKTILTGKIKANIYEHFTCYHVPRHNMEKIYFIVFFYFYYFLFLFLALNISIAMVWYNITCFYRLIQIII